MRNINKRHSLVLQALLRTFPTMNRAILGSRGRIRQPECVSTVSKWREKSVISLAELLFSSESRVEFTSDAFLNF